MKKLGLLVLALLFTTTLSAQFVMDKDRVIDSSTGKDYAEREYPGKPASMLYDAALKVLEDMRFHFNPRHESVANESITIHEYSPSRIYSFSLLGSEQKMDIRMVLKVHFADGQVRIDCPVISPMFYRGGTEDNPRLHYYFFNYDDYLKCSGDATCVYGKNGRVKQPRIKESVEEFVNDYISEIFHGILIHTGSNESEKQTEI